MATLVPVDWNLASKVHRDGSNTVNVAVVPVLDRDLNLLEPHASADKHIQLWHPDRVAFDGSSTYHEDYPGWQPPPRGAAVRSQLTSGFVAGGAQPPTQTTSQAGFPPRQLTPSEPSLMGSQTMADAAPVRFNGLTSYQKAYVAPPLPRRMSGANVGWAGDSTGPTAVVADMRTTTQRDFPAHQVIPRRRATPQGLTVFEPEKPAPPAGFAKDSMPFEGVTAYTDECATFLREIRCLYFPRKCRAAR